VSVGLVCEAGGTGAGDVAVGPTVGAALTGGTTGATVVVGAGIKRPASAVRSAKAKPRPARASVATPATSASGVRHRGVVAMRVLAAAPQSRHQS